MTIFFLDSLVLHVLDLINDLDLSCLHKLLNLSPVLLLVVLFKVDISDSEECVSSNDKRLVDEIKRTSWEVTFKEASSGNNSVEFVEEIFWEGIESEEAFSHVFVDFEFDILFEHVVGSIDAVKLVVSRLDEILAKDASSAAVISNETFGLDKSLNLFSHIVWIIVSAAVFENEVILVSEIVIMLSAVSSIRGEVPILGE